MSEPSLRDYGWDESFAAAFDRVETTGLEPARVLASSSGIYRLICADGELRATHAGKLAHAAAGSADLPAVGDWVAVRRIDGGREGRIEQTLPRRSTLSRKVPGKRPVEQVVAANVDWVIIVMGLDNDFNPRRLERYLATVLHSGANPIVLLNKTDLCDDLAARVEESESLAQGAPVLPVCCERGEGLDALRQLLAPASTAVLVGSSGAGKSTLINRLFGDEVQRTREVREGDSRGRHTTTHRELFRLPSGALLIDSPGIRELQLWAREESLDQTFEDISKLAGSCRYRDCCHLEEIGCAVTAAVADGELSADRLESYHTLRKELRYLEARQSSSTQRVQKQKWRAIHKEQRRTSKHRRR